MLGISYEVALHAFTNSYEISWATFKVAQKHFRQQNTFPTFSFRVTMTRSTQSLFQIGKGKIGKVE